MPPCIIKTCPNWNNQLRDLRISYFKFPENNSELLEKWKRNCQVNTVNKKARICALHFSPESFVTKVLQSSNASKNFLELKSFAIPTENLPLISQELSPIKRKALISSVPSNDNSIKKLKNQESQQLQSLSNEILNSSLSCPAQLLQTNDSIDVNHLQAEIEALKEENFELKEKITYNEGFVESKIRRKVFEVLCPVLQISEINQFLHPEKTPHKWTKEDLGTAVALRCIIKNHKNTSYIKNSQLTTYRKQLSEFTLKPGIIKDLIPLMLDKHKSFATHERLSFLHLQEIDISSDVFSNEKILYGMLRGLCQKWKNLIYFNYHQPYSAEIFNEIVETITICNYGVVAIVTDLQSASVWDALKIGITDDKTRYFANPSYEDLKVFAFVDPIELIKVLRNHFLDFGFQYKDKILDKRCLEELLLLDAHEIRVPNKLAQKHLNVHGADRYAVIFATQIFSNTTAQCVKWCGSNGLLASEFWSECAEFIKTVNDWFDIISIKPSNNSIFGNYGTDIKKQNEILDKMTSYMENIRIENHQNLLPVQKSIILNNLSLKELLPYLQNQYDSPNYLINQISFSFH